MEETPEAETQELYFTSGESSDLEDELQEKTPPEERKLVSSASIHVLSEMKKTTVMIALIEGEVED